MFCATVRTMFDRFLTGELPPARAGDVRQHLDQCRPCWRAWDRMRWDLAAETSLYAEFMEYLGDRFTPYLDSSGALADVWDRASPCTAEQLRAFYRNTDAYLYNQVIWHASGNRPRYVQAAMPILAHHPGSLILDYGCGIGEDVIALHGAGFRVVGCDIASPPTDFLAWRAPRLGYPHPVYQPADLPTTPAPDILWIIDTLDHIPDLDAALGNLLHRVRLAICENLQIARGHGRQGFHHRRPLSTIDSTFARHGLIRAMHRGGPLTIWTRSHRPAAPLPARTAQ
jgi:SAM-dependent methyltransferase